MDKYPPYLMISSLGNIVTGNDEDRLEFTVKYSDWELWILTIKLLTSFNKFRYKFIP